MNVQWFLTPNLWKMIPEFQPPWSFSSPRSQSSFLRGFEHTIPSTWASLSFLMAWPTLLSHRASSVGAGMLVPPDGEVSSRQAWTRWAISSPLSIWKGHKRIEVGSHVTPGRIPGLRGLFHLRRQPCVICTSPYFPDVETEAEKSWSGNTGLLAMTLPGWWWWGVLEEPEGRLWGSCGRAREESEACYSLWSKPSGSVQATLSSVKTNTVGATEWR